MLSVAAAGVPRKPVFVGLNVTPPQPDNAETTDMASRANALERTHVFVKRNKNV